MEENNAMAGKRIYHTDQEWLDLIMQCRQSGLSDAQWCRQNGIPDSSFYNAVSRLRKKACSIPESSVNGRSEKSLDLTSGAPDVVPVRIEPEISPAAEITPAGRSSATHLDNPHSIEILLGSIRIRICNGTDPALLSAVLSSMWRYPC